MTLPGSNLLKGRAGIVTAAALTVALAACGDDNGGFVGPTDDLACSIPQSQILSGQRKDGIPALTNPQMAFAGQEGTEYLREDDRVIGIVFEGEPMAIPLNIMWWHEVVNLDGGTEKVAVTHCPLTGSSLAFDRGPIGGAEFGVSGLLFQTNLIMYDRTTDESLWPQMSRGARCGPNDGTQLRMIPIVETTWSGWQRLHPDTKVVTEFTGWPRPYQSYPYGNYDVASNRDLLFPISGPIDTRRPPKERVLGIPDGTGGIAFPFGELQDAGDVVVVQGTLSTGSYVVLWESSRQGAMAYRPELDGAPVTLEVVDGKIVDQETGSEWRMDGRAIDGELEGRQLEAIDEAYVSFWFAWPNFQPDTELWGTS